MDLVAVNYLEIIISCLSFILFLLFLITIKKNSDNIFFSMRSANVMQITNLAIFLSLLSYSLSHIFYDDLKDKAYTYFLYFYSIFQLIIFASLVLRYHRLYICCKTKNIGRDELLQFREFKIKSYHYEYFYVRIMAIIILIILISSGLFYYFSDKSNIMFNYEILFNKHNSKDIDNIDQNQYFWIILSFIESFVFITYALLIIKTHLNPKVNISYEIILIAVINYFYFLSIGLSFIDNKIDSKIFFYIPILYNLLIYFVSMGLPFLWGRYNDTVFNYDLPGELVSSLYLFLTKEKCFDLFYNFLYNQGMNRDKGIFYLDMLINIFKYRLLIFNNQDHLLIVQEMNKIEREYLGNNRNYFDPNLVNQMKNACIENRETPKINVFDPITNVIYDYLDGEFQKYIKTEEFDSLKNELMQETYVRCKLANYGLIRN